MVDVVVGLALEGGEGIQEVLELGVNGVVVARGMDPGDIRPECKQRRRKCPTMSAPALRLVVLAKPCQPKSSAHVAARMVGLDRYRIHGFPGASRDYNWAVQIGAPSDRPQAALERRPEAALPDAGGAAQTKSAPTGGFSLVHVDHIMPAKYCFQK